MKKVIYILFPISILLILAFGTLWNATKTDAFQLITKTKTFAAGNPVALAFESNSTTKNPQLYIIHSYGKTLIEGKKNNGKITYNLPDLYTKKSGDVSWFLLDNGETQLEGTFEIIPNNQTKTQIENYLGPRSIMAGGSEFTMMVCVPTDAFDNPVVENTAALIKSQFLNSIVTTPEKTKDFIAWKNIYSSKSSGKILGVMFCGKTSTWRFDDQKILRFQRILMEALNRPRCKLQLLQSVLGVMNTTIQLCPTLRAFRTPILHDLTAA